METTIDAAGRIVIPKALREALGFTEGMKLEICPYGSGLTIVARGLTARLVEEDGRLVAQSDRMVTDDDVFALVDSGRR